MPPQVVNRADAMLQILEAKNNHTVKEGEKCKKQNEKEEKNESMPGYQLSFIQLEDPTLMEIKDKILNIDIDTLTPLEALLKLNEIKKIVGKK